MESIGCYSFDLLVVYLITYGMLFNTLADSVKRFFLCIFFKFVTYLKVDVTPKK